MSGLSLNTQTTIAFKNLLNKSNTDVTKGLGNEAEDIKFNIHSDTIFVNPISATTATAIAAGVAVFVQANLTLDGTSNGHAYFATWPVTPPTGTDPFTALPYAYGSGVLTGISAGQRVKNAISFSYGTAYEVIPYSGPPVIANRIFVNDPRNWVYQYQSGIFFQENIGAAPQIIEVYAYTGQILTDVIGVASSSIPLAGTSPGFPVTGDIEFTDGVKIFLNTSPASYIQFHSGLSPSVPTVEIAGNLLLLGDLSVYGTTTTIHEETVQVEDNNIVMNFGGTHTTANGGGITIQDGISTGVPATFEIDTNGDWYLNGFKLKLSGNLTTTGSFNTTLVQQFTGSITLPAVATTLVGKTGTNVTNNVTLWADADQVTSAAAGYLTFDGSLFKVGPSSLDLIAFGLGTAETLNGVIGINAKNISAGTSAYSVIAASESSTNYVGMFNYNASKSSVYVGTSISLASTGHIASSNATLGGRALVINGLPIYNISGNTSTNYGSRLDAAGLKIDQIQFLHLASALAKLHVKDSTNNGSTNTLLLQDSVGTNMVTVNSAGNVNVGNLAGVGSRLVEADSSGNLFATISGSSLGLWELVGSDIVTSASLLSPAVPNVLPAFNDLQDLGSVSNRWRDLYLGSKIDFSSVLDFAVGNSPFDLIGRFENAGLSMYSQKVIKSQNGNGQINMDYFATPGVVAISSDAGGLSESFLFVHPAQIQLYGKVTYVSATAGQLQMTATSDVVITGNGTNVLGVGDFAADIAVADVQSTSKSNNTGYTPAPVMISSKSATAAVGVNTSVFLGGVGHSMFSSVSRSAIIGGSSNTIQTAVNAVLIGGSGNTIGTGSTNVIVLGGSGFSTGFVSNSIFLADNSIIASTKVIKSTNGGGQIDLDYGGTASLIALTTDNGAAFGAALKLQDGAVILQDSSPSASILINTPDTFIHLDESSQLITISSTTLTGQIDLNVSAMSLSISTIGGTKFTDSRISQQGIEYFADYSATYSARSLVDKGYVTGLIAGMVTGTGTTYTLPLWTDGPSSIIGDSLFFQDSLARGAGVGVSTAAVVKRYKEFVHSSDDAGVVGDAQASEQILQALTFDATVTQMSLDSGGLEYLSIGTGLGDNRVVGFEVFVSAVQTGGVAGTPGDAMIMKFRGGIKFIGGSATQIGSTTQEIVAVDSGASAWTVVVDSDPLAVVGGVRIRVTGEINKNIKWVAKCNLTEVAY